MERGIRQGFPLSAILFIMSVELLAQKLRSNKDIIGYTFEKTVIKLSQYVDDMTLMLSNKESINLAIEELIMFGNVAGLKLNLDKTRPRGLMLTC